LKISHLSNKIKIFYLYLPNIGTYNVHNIDIKNIYPLIFFVYPNPRGSEETQFTHPGAGVKKLIFERLELGIGRHSKVNHNNEWQIADR